jgi:hypothetical protein
VGRGGVEIWTGQFGTGVFDAIRWKTACCDRKPTETCAVLPSEIPVFHLPFGVCSLVFGVCSLASGVCCLAVGVCCLAVGVCCLAVGVCCLAVGVCCLAIGVCCLAIGVCCLAIGVCCLAVGVCCLAIGVCCLADGVCCLADGVCYLAFASRHQECRGLLDHFKLHRSQRSARMRWSASLRARLDWSWSGVLPGNARGATRSTFGTRAATVLLEPH